MMNAAYLAHTGKSQDVSKVNFLFDSMCNDHLSLHMALSVKTDL